MKMSQIITFYLSPTLLSMGSITTVCGSYWDYSSICLLMSHADGRWGEGLTKHDLDFEIGLTLQCKMLKSEEEEEWSPQFFKRGVRQRESQHVQYARMLLSLKRGLLWDVTVSGNKTALLYFAQIQLQKVIIRLDKWWLPVPPSSDDNYAVSWSTKYTLDYLFIL